MKENTNSTNTNSTNTFTGTLIHDRLWGSTTAQKFGEGIPGAHRTDVAEVELSTQDREDIAYTTLPTCARCFTKHNGECW